MAASSVLISSLLLLAVFTSSCERVEPLLAKRASSPKSVQSPVPTVSAQAHAELLSEMHQVVFGWPPRSQEAFSSLVDSLNQGASLEGMYNGFVNSSGYLQMEESEQGVSQSALNAFNEQIAALGVKMREESKLASIYTLKRLLGDAALQWIASKKSEREALASWYADWAVSMASKKVDFGVSLRNKPDRELHLKWARQASEDRITWEVLNRLHRLMNYTMNETKKRK